MSSTPPTNDGGPPPDKQGSGIEDLWNEKPVRILAVVLACILTVVMIGAASAATVFTATSMFDGKRHSGPRMVHGGPNQKRDRGERPNRPFRPDGNEDGAESGPTVPEVPGLPGLGGGLSGLQHGDIVTEGDTGQSITKRFVRGTVSTVSGATITVKAADGYSAKFITSASTTIRIDGKSATAAAIPKGSTVLAIGTVTGKSVKADLIAVQ